MNTYSDGVSEGGRGGAKGAGKRLGAWAGCAHLALGALCSLLLLGTGLPVLWPMASAVVGRTWGGRLSRMNKTGGIEGGIERRIERR